MYPCVDSSERLAGGNALTDVFYIAVDVVPELLQAATQVIQANFVVRRTNEPIFRTLTVACKQEIALPAAPWQGVILIDAKLLLLLGKDRA
jgi:hypothetical protein